MTEVRSVGQHTPTHHESIDRTGLAFNHLVQMNEKSNGQSTDASSSLLEWVTHSYRMTVERETHYRHRSIIAFWFDRDWQSPHNCYIATLLLYLCVWCVKVRLFRNARQFLLTATSVRLSIYSHLSTVGNDMSTRCCRQQNGKKFVFVNKNIIIENDRCNWCWVQKSYDYSS